MYYPTYRMRRLRQTPALRGLLRETTLTPEDLVLPLVVRHGENVRDPIPGMPGCFLLSISNLLAETREAYAAGVRAVLLFGVPSHKDAGATAAYDPEGVVQLAVKAIKDELPDLIVITDVCVCAYTDQGHCGIFQDGEVLNDVTLEVLAKVAISHAEAGADIVSPSDMMDGRVAAIRNALDDEGYPDTVIMPVASKFASALYDPFRKRRRGPGAGVRRSGHLPGRPGERRGGRARGAAGHRGGRRHHHAQAGARVPRRGQGDQAGDQVPARGLQRGRRVRHGQGGGGQRLAGRAAHGHGDHDGHPPRRAPTSSSPTTPATSSAGSAERAGRRRAPASARRPASVRRGGRCFSSSRLSSARPSRPVQALGLGVLEADAERDLLAPGSLIRRIARRRSCVGHAPAAGRRQRRPAPR